MAVVTNVATGTITQVSGSWTNATAAQLNSANAAYATIVGGTTKNADVGILDLATFGFDSSIPSGALITKVELIVRWKISATGTQAIWGVTYRTDGADGTYQEQTPGSTADQDQTFDVTSLRAWTRADLLNATFSVRARARKGNNNTSLTYSLDYVAVRVTYTDVRSLDGSLPEQSGSLTAVKQVQRSLAGSLPAQTGVLTATNLGQPDFTVNGLDFFVLGEPLAVAEPASGTTGGFEFFRRGEPIDAVTGSGPNIYTRDMAGSLPSQSGSLARIKQAQRSVAGDMPAQAGAVTRVFQALRSLAGSQPSQSGTLTRELHAQRSLAGSLPSQSGSLARLLQALRDIAGNMPSQSGNLTRAYQALRSLAGSLPAQSGELSATSITTRDLAGDLPTPTGALTRILQAVRLVAGNLPAQTGELTRILLAQRSVDGSLPSPSGTLTRIALFVRVVLGDLPSPTGALTRRYDALRSITGDLPAMSGAVTRRLQALRDLAGALPEMTGELTWIPGGAIVRDLFGSLPSPTGALARLYTGARDIAGSLPSPLGALYRIALGPFNIDRPRGAWRALRTNLGTLSLGKRGIFGRTRTQGDWRD